MIEKIRNRLTYITPAFLIIGLLLLVIVVAAMLSFLFSRFNRNGGVSPATIPLLTAESPPPATATLTPTLTSTATEESPPEPTLPATPTQTTIPTMTATPTVDTPTITVTPSPTELLTLTPTPIPETANVTVIACVTALNESGPGFVLYDLPGRLPKSRGIDFRDELLLLEGPVNDGQGILWWRVRKVSDGEEGWAALGPIQNSSLMTVHDC